MSEEAPPADEAPAEAPIPEEEAAPAAEQEAAPPAEREGAAPPAEGDAGQAEGDGAAPAEEAPAEAGEPRAEGEGAAAPAEGGEEAPPGEVTPPAEGGEPAPAEAAPGEGGEQTVSVEVPAAEAAAPAAPEEPAAEGAAEEAPAPVAEGEGEIVPVEEAEPEEYVEPEIDPTPELEAALREYHERIEGLHADNMALQKRVIQYKHSTQKAGQSQPDLEGQQRITEHKYLNVLSHVNQIRVKLRTQQVRGARIGEELRAQLEDKRAKGIECRDSFRDFKRQVAKNAEYSRTGKGIPGRIITEIEKFEGEKEAEVEEVRGSNISLKNRLAKLELMLRKKDELAENLHVIDFEQLKIENQTLNEKIEERNEELHKLRKKTITVVQILTHMREKLQFVEEKNDGVREDLSLLEGELTQRRDLLTQLKRERDEDKAENARLKQQAGISSSEAMASDYAGRKAKIDRLKEEISAMTEDIKRKSNFAKTVFQLVPQN